MTKTQSKDFYAKGIQKLVFRSENLFQRMENILKNETKVFFLGEV